MLAKHYDAIPDENDVEEQTRPFQSPRGGLDASSSSANTKSSTNNIVSSFAMGCAVSLAAFGVAWLCRRRRLRRPPAEDRLRR